MTTKVFGGTLRHLPTEHVNHIFKDIGIVLTGELEYTLHETFPTGSKEPDVLIDDADGQTVLIEAKRRQQEPTEQLKNEYNELEQHREGENYIVLLTAHPSRPSYLDDLNIDVYWISWKHIQRSLSQQLSEDQFSSIGESLVSETVEMLRQEGNAHFRGFETTSEECIEGYQETDRLYENFSRLVKDVCSHISNSLEFDDLHHYGGQSDNLLSKTWKYNKPSLWYAFNLEGQPTGREKPHLFVLLRRPKGLIRVGYQIRPSKNPDHRDSFERHSDEIAELWSEEEFEILEGTGTLRERYRLKSAEEVREYLGDIDEFERMLTRETDARGLSRIILTREFKLDTLNQQDAVETIADELNYFHRITFLSDDKQGLGQSRQHIFYPNYQPNFD
ncbi:hypothetical protein ACFO5R_00920 [Halosolutus amylolyticus]|uniref:Uncharacterized protein n=2 Tax=Halosolutus amylolyticus TaxID=2932267 RepID=A0ABD5PIV6_9EURY